MARAMRALAGPPCACRSASLSARSCSMLARPTWRTLAVGRRGRLAGEADPVWAAGHLEKSREVTRSGPYRCPASAVRRVVDDGGGVAIGAGRGWSRRSSPSTWGHDCRGRANGRGFLRRRSAKNTTRMPSAARRRWRAASAWSARGATGSIERSAACVAICAPGAEGSAPRYLASGPALLGGRPTVALRAGQSRHESTVPSYDRLSVVLSNGRSRAVSSVGRAPALHAGCHRFESCTAHQPSPPDSLRCAQPADRPGRMRRSHVRGRSSVG